MRKLNAVCLAVLAAGLLMAGRAVAEETNNLTTTLFKNGYLSWTNINPNLYYTVEYRPNLSETNPAWDGSHRVSQDVKSTNAIITVPVGFFYRVVGSTNPLHTFTLSPSNGTMAAGYYAATTLSAVDTNLTAANIKTNVTIFGVVGTLSTAGGGVYSAAIPKTGQTNVVQTGDDGTYQKGVAWPNPRFTIQADTNCVLDNMTGLIWARNANLGGYMNWSNAIVFCEGLTYGGQTDWRLPNRSELNSLIDARNYNPALPKGQPFAGPYGNYWSGTSYANNGAGNAWSVYMAGGDVVLDYKTEPFFAWPVRGGQ